jgi:uncharacterized protein
VRWRTEVLDLFWDEARVFHDTAADGEPLVVRPRSVDDNATPSGNSAATLMLLRLSALTGEVKYERVASQCCASMGGLLERAPLAFGHLLAALDFHLATPREVVIVGDARADDTRALLDVVRERYRPTTVLALRNPARAQEADALVPLLAGRGAVEGRATAYVCSRFTCRRPVTDPATLRRELDG